MATCGSGVKIGKVFTVVSHRLILQVLIVGLAACTVEVAGATLQASVARHAVTATRLTAVTAALGSAWSSPSNDFLFRVIHSYYKCPKYKRDVFNKG